MACEWSNKIFSVGAAGFEPLALEIFKFQYDQNPAYSSYVNALSVSPGHVNSLDKIPFLPISFFKTHEIKAGDFIPEVVFESSGTTQSGKSHHLVRDLTLYSEGFTKTFEMFYGPVTDWCVLGLMPSLSERTNSSLVYMVSGLMRKSLHPLNGFYMHDDNRLAAVLEKLEAIGQKTLLIGLSFALLDFAERNLGCSLKHTIIMETGGMKGRREEKTRDETHSILKHAFAVDQIHSEYGMTELLSQAYSKADGIFNAAPWMKVLVRDEEDPLSVRHLKGVRHAGAINIIDLANVYSCSFIATEDAGLVYADGSFEILGRLDGSDLRGCSLMAPPARLEGTGGEVNLLL